MDNKSNFASMTTEELRKYIFKHGQDNEAFYKLLDRVRANEDDSIWMEFLKSFSVRGKRKTS